MRELLIEIGEDVGFTYDNTTETFSPEPTGSRRALNQKEDLKIENYNMIGMIIFYFSSAMWVISYLRLIFTDITTYNYPVGPNTP